MNLGQRQEKENGSDSLGSRTRLTSHLEIPEDPLRVFLPEETHHEINHSLSHLRPAGAVDPDEPGSQHQGDDTHELDEDVHGRT